MSGELRLVVKWSGQEFEVDGITEMDNVQTLKDAIFRKTGVRPERQKLLNLKYKGKLVENDVQLLSLNLKNGFKVMMMGSREEAIADANTVPDDLPPIVDDFDIPEEEEVTENQDVYLAKISRRIREYQISMLNEPREGKKLLVLDIDYTLFDHRSVAENGFELMRPYLHEFLTSAYRDYDIAIWSATNMKWIEEKMKILGVSSHPDYKIVFYLDCVAMISVYTKKHGVVQVKPLGVIWGKFEQYTADNTIMFDDIRRNFLMNKQNGLRVRPFRQAHLNRDKDRELLKLAKYLRAIGRLDSLQNLNHKQWEKYLRRITKDRRKTNKKNNNNNNNADPDSSTGCQDGSRPSTSS